MTEDEKKSATWSAEDRVRIKEIWHEEMLKIAPTYIECLAKVKDDQII